ncbi:MAG: hypothetical protein M3162_07155 [Thermoproteota archaeon]|nr:hypothetical protein [Thermoproteota archaeon]
MVAIENKDEIYQVIDKIPEDKLRGLDQKNKDEINKLKQYLSKRPIPEECKRIKKLRSSLSHLYIAYIGGRALRLTFTINLNTHKIVLVGISNRQYQQKKHLYK